MAVSRSAAVCWIAVSVVLSGLMGCGLHLVTAGSPPAMDALVVALVACLLGAVLVTRVFGTGQLVAGAITGVQTLTHGVVTNLSPSGCVQEVARLAHPVPGGVDSTTCLAAAVDMRSMLVVAVGAFAAAVLGATAGGALTQALTVVVREVAGRLGGAVSRWAQLLEAGVALGFTTRVITAATTARRLRSRSIGTCPLRGPPVLLLA